MEGSSRREEGPDGCPQSCYRDWSTRHPISDFSCLFFSGSHHARAASTMGAIRWGPFSVVGNLGNHFFLPVLNSGGCWLNHGVMNCCDPNETAMHFCIKSFAHPEPTILFLFPGSLPFFWSRPDQHSTLILPRLGQPPRQVLLSSRVMMVPGSPLPVPAQTWRRCPTDSPTRHDVPVWRHGRKTGNTRWHGSSFTTTICPPCIIMVGESSRPE
ncbi:hypothetical protein QBC39DRAFT_182715 [Podospora conica]|nr:hypothetical protein QBC39DRAFT_182715 [Schizothecium conicum]